MQVDEREKQKEDEEKDGAEETEVDKRKQQQQRKDRRRHRNLRGGADDELEAQTDSAKNANQEDDEDADAGFFLSSSSCRVPILLSSPSQSCVSRRLVRRFESTASQQVALHGGFTCQPVVGCVSFAIGHEGIALVVGRGVTGSVQLAQTLTGVLFYSNLFLHSVQQLRDQLDDELTVWRANPDNARIADDMFRKFDELTSDLVQELTEKLRLIVEPTLASKLQGDFRSGKRISMKKVLVSHSLALCIHTDMYDVRTGHSVHCLAVPQGQDLAPSIQAQQA